MHKIILFLFSLIVVFSSCNTSKSATDHSNTSATTETNASNYQKLEKALLWKISGNDLAAPSYLYGTIHMIPSDEYFLPEGTLSAIGGAKKIMFEIDMKDMNDISKQMGLLNQAFMKDDLTLKDLYTDEQYAKVKKHFDSMGIPLFLMERMKPMFLTVFASGDVDPGDLQSGKIKSYEMEFYDLAESSNKETGGLETIEYQMSVFDSIPYQEQADMLLQTIEMGDESSGSMEEMVKVYKEQDIEGMQTLFEEDDSGIEGHEDVLLVNRNKNWIPVMSEEMKNGPIFFAVGAGHLGGPLGVINLLREAGFTLEPVLK